MSQSVSFLGHHGSFLCFVGRKNHRKPMKFETNQWRFRPLELALARLQGSLEAWKSMLEEFSCFNVDEAMKPIKMMVKLSGSNLFGDLRVMFFSTSQRNASFQLVFLVLLHLHNTRPGHAERHKAQSHWRCQSEFWDRKMLNHFKSSRN